MGYTLEDVKKLQEMLNRPEEPDTRPRDPLSTARRIMAHTQGQIGGYRADLLNGQGLRRHETEIREEFLRHFELVDPNQLPSNYREEYIRIQEMGRSGNWNDAEFLDNLGKAERRFYGAPEESRHRSDLDSK